MKLRAALELGLILALAGAALRATGAAAGEFRSFPTDVMPFLTKAGCNSGACHGAATGQGGFKLSLLGYDPAEDYEKITRELGGRRIDRTEPAASLFLRKPTRQIDHEGGRRIARDSAAYRVLEDWIRAGAPYGAPQLRVARVEVEPALWKVRAPAETIALRVTATLSDGASVDATALALYSSNDDAVAAVAKDGRASAAGPGATSLVVRYSGQVAAVQVVSPFNPAARPQRASTGSAADELIDRRIDATLADLGIPRSAQSRSEEFVRRLHLDLAGRLPTVEQARQYARQARSRAGREALVDWLLRGEEFTDLWTLHLADVLLISGRRGTEAGAAAYQGWVREQLQAGLALDQMARQLLLAAGDVSENGPANFYTVAADPRDMGEHVARMLLGVQLGCARCHAHPTDRWTREDYHRFAAYFPRVIREGSTIRVHTAGEVEDPKTGEPLEPRPLGAADWDNGAESDRRAGLARWLAADGGPMLARAWVNRVWKLLLGRGLVEPVDDLRPTNPGTHPQLLDELARWFAADGYDLRRLIRKIALSQAYQRASQTVPGNETDARFYSRALVKELPAQVFADAVAQATGVPDAYAGYAEGTRAVALIGASTPSYTLEVLGRCARDRSCDGDAAGAGGLARVLHLVNGPLINSKLRDERSIAHSLARASSDARAIAVELYWRAYGREPSAAERAHGAQVIGAGASRLEGIQDLLWALLNSREFAFNH